MEHHYPVCREEDDVFTQTAAERAYDVASLEPRGRASLQRFSGGCPLAEVKLQGIGSDADG